ncbi:MAG: glycosyltransferase, partial [Candidatus Omnitrophica bacterium]|nr:glycosyltransferase [Candidatus Omnitrophota bacterium]
MEPTISAVIMAYNEEQSLEGTFAELATVLKELKSPYEIVIIDDGSTDKTGISADRLAHHDNVRVIHHYINQRLGAVYRTGFKEARWEYI